MNDARIVQGLLDRKMLASGGMARAEDAMSLPPPTIRPSARRAAIAERMREQELVLLTVTHPDGVLVGVVRREDLE